MEKPSYNVAVPRMSRGRFRRTSSHASAQKLETIGLLVVILLILAITITRSWHHIPWSAR